ncbi:MarR family winged helix-turn-helix transcriptional regulator [Salaquimonas pukyongi]|uniref:MarR family winged helix-turn-helix transcriptional regulator n=1 Tax=Salaquimonas pukyongi TaxID=2712698 RepID=UPI00096B688D|nr:MarR family transcriptional regulator [Salaquimonas pukyongi]
MTATTEPDAEHHAEPLTGNDVSEIELIELLFFAYRDFVGDADRILEALGFGRAHHRVLYFVNRRPSMTVAELLDLLAITKQSLARVLKQLVESGYIVQKTGREDRRQRLLFPTPAGRELILRLSAPQSRRINTALKAVSTVSREEIAAFLGAMRNPPAR